MARCHFIDVYAGGESLGDYPWPINHSSEDEGGATLNIERTAPTASVGFVRQLGDPSPYTKRLRGTILDRSQLQKMWEFFQVCVGLGPGPHRTIHWVDQLGGRFEVMFLSFNPVAVRTSSNPRGATADEKLVYWTYDLQLEVINVIENWP